MEQFQGNHFVHWHDLGVAQCGGEQVAESGQTFLHQTGLGGAGLHQHWPVRPGPGERGSVVDGGLGLRTATRPQSAMEVDCGLKNHSLTQVGRDGHQNRSRGSQRESPCRGITAQSGRIHAPAASRQALGIHRRRRGGTYQRPGQSCHAGEKQGVGAFRIGRGRPAKQLGKSSSQLDSFLGSPGGLPLSQDGTRWNGQAAIRAGGQRFRMEVPHGLVAQAIGMGITRLYRIGHIPCQAPLLAIGAGQIQFQVGQVARVVAVAGPDCQGQQIALADGQARHRPNRLRGATLGNTAGQPLARAAPDDFQRPGDPITAFGVGVLHRTCDINLAVDGAFPAHTHRPVRRWVNTDTMRLEDTRYANGFVGRVGHQVGQVPGGPAGDSRMATAIGNLVGHVFECRAGTGGQTQVAEPGLERGIVDGMFFRQGRQVHRSGAVQGFSRGRQGLWSESQ